MSLTKVFDALSDAILVINETGEVNYFNQPASILVNGTHIETIGIGRLGEMLKLVLNEQIRLPFTFKTRTSSNTEYQTTVSKLYSFYIVALSVQLPTTDNQFALDKKSKSLNSVGSQFHDFINEEIDLFSNFFISQVPSSDYPLLDEALKLKQRLNMLMNAIFLSDPKEIKSLVEMLDFVDDEKVFPLISKSVELNIYGLSEIDSPLIFCHPEWFEIILGDCLNHLIYDENTNFDAVVSVDQDSHYITLHITPGNDSVAPFHQNVAMKKKLKSLTQNTDVNPKSKRLQNIPLATHLIKRLHGYIAVMNQDASPSILIKLPTGSPTQDENNMLLEQSRLFAQELGKLKLKMDEANNR